MPAAVDVAAYRIVQESLTNVMRHAGVNATATVTIRHEADAVRIEVVDDGRGAASAVDADRRGGHGIAGMAERAATVGGDVIAGPRPGGGFRVRARLPLSSSVVGRTMTAPAEPVVIRVVLADDQVLLRAGLRMLLDAEDDIEVVGEADDGAAAIELTRQLLPDVVVMDIRMPNVDGLAATRTIVADPVPRVGPRRGAHHVRPRRVRVRGDPRRRDRVPPEGRRADRAAARGAGRGERRVAAVARA